MSRAHRAAHRSRLVKLQKEFRAQHEATRRGSDKDAYHEALSLLVNTTELLACLRRGSSDVFGDPVHFDPSAQTEGRWVMTLHRLMEDALAEEGRATSVRVFSEACEWLGAWSEDATHSESPFAGLTAEIATLRTFVGNLLDYQASMVAFVAAGPCAGALLAWQYWREGHGQQTYALRQALTGWARVYWQAARLSRNAEREKEWSDFVALREALAPTFEAERVRDCSPGTERHEAFLKRRPLARRLWSNGPFADVVDPAQEVKTPVDEHDMETETAGKRKPGGDDQEDKDAAEVRAYKRRQWEQQREAVLADLRYLQERAVALQNDLNNAVNATPRLAQLLSRWDQARSDLEKTRAADDIMSVDLTAYRQKLYLESTRSLVPHIMRRLADLDRVARHDQEEEKQMETAGKRGRDSDASDASERGDSEEREVLLDELQYFKRGAEEAARKLQQMSDQDETFRRLLSQWRLGKDPAAMQTRRALRDYSREGHELKKDELMARAHVTDIENELAELDREEGVRGGTAGKHAREAAGGGAAAAAAAAAAEREAKRRRRADEIEAVKERLQRYSKEVVGYENYLNAVARGNARIAAVLGRWREGNTPEAQASRDELFDLDYYLFDRKLQAEQMRRLVRAAEERLAELEREQRQDVAGKHGRSGEGEEKAHDDDGEAVKRRRVERLRAMLRAQISAMTAIMMRDAKVSRIMKAWVATRDPEARAALAEQLPSAAALYLMEMQLTRATLRKVLGDDDGGADDLAASLAQLDLGAEVSGKRKRGGRRPGFDSENNPTYQLTARLKREWERNYQKDVAYANRTFPEPQNRYDYVLGAQLSRVADIVDQYDMPPWWNYDVHHPDTPEHRQWLQRSAENPPDAEHEPDDAELRWPEAEADQKRDDRFNRRLDRRARRAAGEAKSDSDSGSDSESDSESEPELEEEEPAKGEDVESRYKRIAFTEQGAVAGKHKLAPNVGLSDDDTSEDEETQPPAQRARVAPLARYRSERQAANRRLNLHENASADVLFNWSPANVCRECGRRRYDDSGDLVDHRVCLDLWNENQDDDGKHDVERDDRDRRRRNKLEDLEERMREHVPISPEERRAQERAELQREIEDFEDSLRRTERALESRRSTQARLAAAQSAGNAEDVAELTEYLEMMVAEETLLFRLRMYQSSLAMAQDRLRAFDARTMQ